MNREKRKIINLLSYGIDSKLASRLVSKGYGVTKIKSATINELAPIFGENEAKAIINCVRRKPISEEVILRLIVDCDWKCCLCWNVDEVEAVIIHHLDEYSRTQDNSYENLVVLCPNHHAHAHSKSTLSGELFPVRLIRERKEQFTEAISEWKKGNRVAPGREGGTTYTARQKEFLKQKQRVESRLKRRGCND